MPYYPPIVLAKVLSTVDHLSAGRLDAGLGIGWLPAELEAAGSQADLSHIDEPIAIVRAAAADAGRDPAELRFVCRGVVKVRAAAAASRVPLTGSLDEIRDDLAALAEKGVTETFVDLDFDPEIGSPETDDSASMHRAEAVLEALAPG